MSRGNWKKHEGADEEILKVLSNGEIMTTRLIWFEVRKTIKISYDAVQRRLNNLMNDSKVKFLGSPGSTINLWQSVVF